MQLERLVSGVQHLGRLPEVGRCRAVVPEWKALTACYLGYGMHFPLTVTLPTGRFTFHTLADVRTFWVVWFARTYPIKSTDDLIVDAGANIGTFTLYALTNAPRCHVIAIEPAPDSFGCLSRMIAAHGLSNRCTLLQAGLGNSCRKSCIDLRLQSQFRRTGAGDTEVDLITLGDVLRDYAALLGMGRIEMNPLKVDLLKMDIEGAELDAISPPGSLNGVQRISMEFHPPLAVEQIADKLSETGLAPQRVRRDGGGYGLLWAARTGVA